MSINEAAAEQIERFIRAGFTPIPSPELQQELISVFVEISGDADHAKRIGDWLMKTEGFFPKPASVVRADQDMQAFTGKLVIEHVPGVGRVVSQSRQPEEFVDKRWLVNCHKCRDTGFEPDDPRSCRDFPGEVYNFVKRCSCRRDGLS